MSDVNEIQQLKRRLNLAWILMVLLAIALVMPTFKLWLNLGVTGTPRPITPRGELADFEKATSAIFRNTSPSVVYINTRARVANRFSRRVFEVEAGTGSGFVWDDAGHIITNYHVIEEASSAQVVFYDQSAYEATLVGASPEHDLAVLRVRPRKELLRPVLIGESANLVVGQSVFAIGNPFGLEQTLTTGVVSAKSRRIETPAGKNIEGAIQIDAAINPGNSGGPLLDSASRLIGVNTAIYSPSGTSAGVGFAIPVDTVNRVVPQIIAGGKYEPPRLGISASDEVSRAVSSRTGIQGITILNVTPGGGAEAAGLRKASLDSRGSLVLGDILQKVGGYEVTTIRQLEDALDEFDIGDTIDVTIHREGQTETLQVTLQ